MADLTANLPSIDGFFKSFRRYFSQKQHHMLSNCVLSLFLEYKRCSLQSMAEKISCNYQKLQYFVSDSKWESIEDLNQSRLASLYREKQTAPTNKGVCIIDDTGCPKPYAKKTEGAKYQHCGSTHREEVCNVIVFSAYADQNKHFPIEFTPYKPKQEFDLGKEDPQFKSKIQIADNMIEHIAADPHLPNHCVIDSWYGAADLIKNAFKLNVILTGELKSSRKVRFYIPDRRRHEYVSQDELVKLIYKHYSHKVSYIKKTDKNGNVKQIPTYTFESKLKDCPVAVRIVVVLEKLFDEDKTKTRVLFTTCPKLSPQEITDVYCLRWGVERIFQEIKDNFSFDQYQMRSLKHIQRFWFLCILAWTLTYRLKMIGALKKVVILQSDTFPEYVRAVRNLIRFSEIHRLSKSNCPEKTFRILSKRVRKRAG